MNPTRKRRLILILAVLAAAALAVSLTLWALAQNMNYLFTPSQVLAGQAQRYQTFRLGGMVKAGSIEHDAHSLKVRFVVVDANGAMSVSYDGILPDLFRDNQSVIVTGHRQGDGFVASEVLAKHDETYMPKELKEAMQRAHAQHPLPAGAAQP